jgi:hypothetical protein
MNSHASLGNLWHNLNHTRNFFSRPTGINLPLVQQGMRTAHLPSSRQNSPTEVWSRPTLIPTPLCWNQILPMLLTCSTLWKANPHSFCHPSLVNSFILLWWSVMMANILLSSSLKNKGPPVQLKIHQTAALPKWSCHSCTATQFQASQ